MATWNLSRIYANNDIVDVIEGPYSLAKKRARELEEINGWKIAIFETLY